VISKHSQVISRSLRATVKIYDIYFPDDLLSDNMENKGDATTRPPNDATRSSTAERVESSDDDEHSFDRDTSVTSSGYDSGAALHELELEAKAAASAARNDILQLHLSRMRRKKARNSRASHASRTSGTSAVSSFLTVQEDPSPTQKTVPLAVERGMGIMDYLWPNLSAQPEDASGEPFVSVEERIAHIEKAEKNKLTKARIAMRKAELSHARALQAMVDATEVPVPDSELGPGHSYGTPRNRPLVFEPPPGLGWLAPPALAQPTVTLLKVTSGNDGGEPTPPPAPPLRTLPRNEEWQPDSNEHSQRKKEDDWWRKPRKDPGDDPFDSSSSSDVDRTGRHRRRRSPPRNHRPQSPKVYSDKLVLGPWPTTLQFPEWKRSLRSEVAAASDHPQEATAWIFEVERLFCTMNGIKSCVTDPFRHLESCVTDPFRHLDAKLQAALQKITKSEQSHKLAILQEKLALQGRLISGRQHLLFMYLDFANDGLRTDSIESLSSRDVAELHDELSSRDVDELRDWLTDGDDAPTPSSRGTTATPAPTEGETAERAVLPGH
jgi:hypothetical protein